MKTCKNCSVTEPSAFYETQHTRYCKKCFTDKYFVPGRARLRTAKMSRGQCHDCGLKVTEGNSCVFDFDHLADKKRTISTMTTAPNKTFEEEVNKCDLVCSNCHRLRTQARGRTWASPGRPRKTTSPEDLNRPRELPPILLG